MYAACSLIATMASSVTPMFAAISWGTLSSAPCAPAPKPSPTAAAIPKGVHIRSANATPVPSYAPPTVMAKTACTDATHTRPDQQ